MQFPSLTLIFGGIFIAYTLHSIWTIGSLYYPPTCESSELKTRGCSTSYLKSENQLQLLLFTTVKERLISQSDLNFLDVIELDVDSSFTKEIEVSIPLKTRKNGTLYIHAFLSKRSYGNNWLEALNDPSTSYTAAPFTEYQLPNLNTYNLLSEKSKADPGNEDEKREEKVMTHLRSKLLINVLDYKEPLPTKNLPFDIAQVLSFTADGRYLPVLHIDQLASRLEDLVPVNKSTSKLSVTLNYRPISFGKLRLWLQFTGALHTLRQMGFTNKDIDEVKGIFADTNIIFLCMTFAIAAFHLFFDFLAFKNDVSFWRDRDDMVGLSSRTLIWRAFSQFVIFLYLMDEKTSLLIVIPAFIGTFIELWKVKKAFRITLEWQRGMPRFVVGQSRNKEEAQTEEYDSISMRYLSYVLYPLCLGGAIYSLLYTTHRSWYSWILQSVVNGVYAFGFLFMLPQLFVNYKLKSVAHLPWRAFMYKAFNTFIDDIFAFIITMPTSHRVACFRDDIVFVIYLYQRWLYPVDKKRVNEFGATGDDENAKKSN